MTIRLFNLDLHISVIEDFRNICETFYGKKIDITNWSISGHNWVFKKPTQSVEIINQYTWKQINLHMIRKFQDKYDDILKTYDGFVVTHTPIFALLFEKYQKPILIINSCRYDQPMCWTNDITLHKTLDDALKRMMECKQLVIVSNNVADYKYLFAKTGIKSIVLPSLCRYAYKDPYQPTKSTFIAYSNRHLFPTSNVLVEKPSQGYTWEELQSYKGIVHCPYEMSTMSIFEQYWAGIPLFFPTKRFYKECILNGKMEFISPYDKWSQPITETEIDDWLNVADFYLLPFIHYYDSFEECIAKLETFEDTQRSQRLQWLEENSTEICNQWCTIIDKHFIKPKPTPRILLLILASEDTSQEGLYRQMEDLWRLYMNKHSYIDAYFYKADPTLKTNYELKNQTLYVNTEESLDKCYEKMLKTFSYFAPQLYKYDYIFRTNLSSFVVLDKLYDICKTFPKTKFCSAYIGTTDDGTQFPAGAGFTITPDLVRALCLEQPPLITQDDVSLGYALKSWGIPITPAARIDFLQEFQTHFFINYVESNPNVYHYRLKNVEGKRYLDIELYKRLLKYYYAINV